MAGGGGFSSSGVLDAGPMRSWVLPLCVYLAAHGQGCGPRCHLQLTLWHVAGSDVQVT